MRLMVACGGTGGHIYPALAVARAFLEEGGGGDEVRFLGSTTGPEARIVPNAGFPFEGVPVRGLRGKSLGAVSRGALALPFSVLRATARLRRFDPAAVLGTGGYASGPVLAGAVLTRRPVVIQEQNRRLGFTNKLVAPFAREIALSFPETRRELGRGTVTGNPVRAEFFEVGDPPLRPERLSLLVFGGSQGSRTLNRAVVEALPGLVERSPRIFLRHQTGPREHAEVLEAYREAGAEGFEVLPYIDTMAEAFAAADLVVCRAGASTVAELCAAGRGAVLVPYPHATGDHQRENAEALAAHDAALVVDDAAMTGARLLEILDTVRPQALRTMAEAARSLGRPHAARDIARILRDLGAEKGGAS